MIRIFSLNCDYSVEVNEVNNKKIFTEATLKPDSVDDRVEARVFFPTKKANNEKPLAIRISQRVIKKHHKLIE